MPPNTSIFLLGLAVGTGLLLLGTVAGFILGRRSKPTSDVVDRQQFLVFLRELSQWTSEFSGNVSRYQSELSTISHEVETRDSAPREEIATLLSRIMQANQQLQDRLDNAEAKLDSQKDEISNYLTEARTDGLTGLQNRRAFDKATDELFTLWQNKHQSFALGLIDIDHFKQINDTYGHPAGDAVLQRIAQQLMQDLSGSFCIARYGGEEFAVLATADVDEVANTLETLRQNVETIEVTHEEHVISMSMSAGASQIEADDRIGKLVRRADEALYAAKLGGRNRVYVNDGTICRLITDCEEHAEGAEESAPDQEVEQAQSRIQERLQRIVEEESRRVVKR